MPISACGYSASYTDWRVPNASELYSLADADSPLDQWLPLQGFVDVQGGTSLYWSSTPRGAKAFCLSREGRLFPLRFDGGGMNTYVWLVR